VIDAALQQGRGLTAAAEDLTVVSEQAFDPGLITAADRGEQTPLYTLRYNPATRGIEYWAGHDWQPQPTPKALLAETRELIALRDVATSLITSQRGGRPQTERDQLRGHLNSLYDRYVEKHGTSNRFTWVQPQEPTQERHDERMAAAEARWRETQGEPGRPYPGPVPPELLEQWDVAAWSAPAPTRNAATSTAACATTPAGRWSAPWKCSTKTPARPAKPPSSPPTCSPQPRSATPPTAPKKPWR
jgi:hypothetical protein